MKILIVDDEKLIIRPLKQALESSGFAVDYAYDGKDGLEMAQINEYDCILLDLNLPIIDGITFAQKLRNDSNDVPIIMLTARSQIYNKIEGFENGADDYVTKPFNLKELIARINAIIKRNSINKSHNLKFNNFQLFPDKNKITSTDNKEIILSNKETAILEYLLRNKNIIVSQEELLEHIWDNQVDLFTETIKTHIKTLRKKIDPNKTIIKTVRGKGYIIE
jgi:DNA-binding response OmpR family regulator